jgi:hypothetical protein
LAKPDCNLRTIADELEVDRAAIIIAREGILGRADGLLDHYSKKESDEFANAVRSFAEAILDYFFVEMRTGDTGITTLTEQIRFRLDSPFPDPNPNETIQEIRENARYILRGLEAGWKEITKRFERIRLYCETGRP